MSLPAQHCEVENDQRLCFPFRKTALTVVAQLMVWNLINSLCIGHISLIGPYFLAYFLGCFCGKIQMLRIQILPNIWYIRFTVQFL